MPPLASLLPVRHARLILTALANAPDRKPAGRIARDILELAGRERALPRHYFTHMLYKRSSGDPRGWVSEAELAEIRASLSMPYEPDLEDKLRFYELAGARGLPVPALLETLRPGDCTTDTVATKLERAHRQVPGDGLFVKPYDGTSGRDCHRLGPSAGPREIADVAARVKDGARRSVFFLVQAALRQHPDIERLSPDAVGCLRVHTLRRGGELTVLSTLMRFAPGGVVIDAPSAGALFAPVDEQTGTVIGPGRTHFKAGGRDYDRHPVTGETFDGAVLPDWSQAVDVAERAARAFDKALVGWDIAFTTNGPILVEGNSSPHLLLAQIAAGGFRRDPRWWSAVAPVLGDAHGRGTAA